MNQNKVSLALVCSSNTDMYLMLPFNPNPGIVTFFSIVHDATASQQSERAMQPIPLTESNKIEYPLSLPVVASYKRLDNVVNVML